MQTFNDFLLPLPLHQNLTKMGFETPTPVQAASIPFAVKGRDILATAQTGTGKTGAFGIPLLAKLYEGQGKQALVLAPTRELAAQILKVFRDMSKGLKLHGVLVVGGESFPRQARELSRGADFIVATPGRLQDHLNERTVHLNKVAFLVLDEVDRMLDMGFLPQIERILKHVPKERQTLMFSATLPKEVMSLTGRLVRNPERVSIGAVNTVAAKITETNIKTNGLNKSDLLMQEIENRTGRILVFARTQIRAQKVGQVLGAKGHKAVILHGGKSQFQRKDALAKFSSGSHRIMVATDLAGRGLDVPNIEHVINYDPPENKEDYIHRIGRTGRCGNEGNAVNFIEEAIDRPKKKGKSFRSQDPFQRRSNSRFGGKKRNFARQKMREVKTALPKESAFSRFLDEF